MPAELLATFLHLSDLHFGQSIDDSSCVSYPWWELASEGSVALVPHNPDILAQLELDLERICFREALSFDPPLAAREDGTFFDGVVVSGDILTNVFSTNVFNDFAFAFLTSSILFYPNTASTRQIGLHIPVQDLFAVPGNHDKIFRQDLNEYSGSNFCQPPLSCPLYTRTINGRCGTQFIVWGVDSNYYRVPVFALGEIPDGIITTLGQSFQALRGSGRWKGIELKRGEFDKSIRILVLHHSPKYEWDWLYPHMRLKNKDAFLDALEGNVDVVLYGHFHRAAIARKRGILLAQAGSTSQYEPKDGNNSFNILNFWKKDKQIGVSVYKYSWLRNRFLRDWQQDHIFEREKQEREKAQDF